MLYDHKRWDLEVKADPFTLENLIVWLEKQPPEKTYAYNCNGHCLLAQYFTDAGYENVRMFSEGFLHGPKRSRLYLRSARKQKSFTPISAEFNQIAAAWQDRTFGGALVRARAVQS